jgi:hypothetical protein
MFRANERERVCNVDSYKPKDAGLRRTTQLNESVSTEKSVQWDGKGTARGILF